MAIAGASDTNFVKMTTFLFQCVVWPVYLQMNISRRAVEAIEAVHGKDYGVGYAGDLLCKWK